MPQFKPYFKFVVVHFHFDNYALIIINIVSMLIVAVSLSRTTSSQFSPDSSCLASVARRSLGGVMI